MDKLKFRVDLDFIGNGNAAKSYGNKLEAWSFNDIDGEIWFENFKNHVLSCLGKKYLPIYRMADGEYRFLLGRKRNFVSKSFLKELIIFTCETLKLKDPNKWKTSWGEEYPPDKIASLQDKLLKNIRNIAKDGYLACFINDNGLNAFSEYNKDLLPFFRKKKIKFNSKNYIPFHFVVSLLVQSCGEKLIKHKTILVVSGTNETEELNIYKNLVELGAKNVQFLRISKTSSLLEILNLKPINNHIDLCLVAAGIGSANIITQLKPLKTVILDIGGYINCLIDKENVQHGGVFTFPIITNKYGNK